jgi:copper chaperone CopZ
LLNGGEGGYAKKMGAKTGKMMKYLLGTLGLATLLVGVWWGFGTASSFTGGLKNTTFLVERVTCGSCVSAIRDELFKKPGMVGLTADLGQGLFRIEHRPPLNEEAIVRVLADLGYPAKSVREQVEKTGGTPMAKGCSGCGPNGCSATAASWRELFKKWGGFFAP